MVPARSSTAAVSQASPLAGFVKGVKLIDDARYSEALALFNAPALAETPLADYARYFSGVAHLRLDEAASARSAFAALRARRPAGFLAEAALIGAADAAEALNDHAPAVRLYTPSVGLKPAAPETCSSAWRAARRRSRTRRGPWMPTRRSMPSTR
jgi:hypothetical protein